jgi:hypothetical protein
MSVNLPFFRLPAVQLTQYQTATVVMSTDMHVARVSEEFQQLTGQAPQNVVGRVSLWILTLLKNPRELRNSRSPQLLTNLIHRKDKNRFREMCLRVLMHPRIAASPIPGPVAVMTWDRLSRPCLNTLAYAESFRVQRPAAGFRDFQIKVWLGAAFGADMNRPETYRCA